MSFDRYDLINWMKEYPGLKLNAEMFDEQLARMKSAEEFPPMRSDSGSAGGEGRKSEGPPDPMGSAVSKRVDLERKMAATVEQRRMRMSAAELPKQTVPLFTQVTMPSPVLLRQR